MFCLSVYDRETLLIENYTVMISKLFLSLIIISFDQVKDEKSINRFNLWSSKLFESLPSRKEKREKKKNDKHPRTTQHGNK